MKTEVNLSTRPKQKECYLSDLSIDDNLGFIDEFGSKGFFVYIGLNKGDTLIHHAIDATETNHLVANKSYGSIENNQYTEIPLHLNTNTRIKIHKLYKFDTKKELFKWLSE